MGENSIARPGQASLMRIGVNCEFANQSSAYSRGGFNEIADLSRRRNSIVADTRRCTWAD
jgi:hypothetical protein